jgi:hypothetical protein
MSELLKARNPAILRSRFSSFSGETLSNSRGYQNAEIRLDKGERPLTVIEILNTNLEVGVKTMDPEPDTAPPVQGEVPSSVMKQLVSRKAVNKDEETNVNKNSPAPLAALTLPSRTPVSPIQAVSSRQSGDEFDPCTSSQAETCPAEGGQPMEAIRLMGKLHTDVESACRSTVPTFSPPEQEGSISITRPLLERKALVNKQEDPNTPKDSPVAKVALTLPNRSPVLSIRTVPSRQGRDKSQPHPSVVSGRRKPGVCSSASNEVSKRSGVSSPFRSNFRLPVDKPPARKEASATTKQPRNNTVVSKERTSALARSPSSSTGLSFPKPPPAISTQAISPRPSSGETKLPSPTVAKPVQQPIKRAAVSISQTSSRTCLPVPAAVIKLPASAVPMRAAPSRPSRDESKPLLRAAPKPLQPVKKAVISKDKTSATTRSPSVPSIPVPDPFRACPTYTRHSVL